MKSAQLILKSFVLLPKEHLKKAMIVTKSEEKTTTLEEVELIFKPANLLS